jgi:hypothetical protein
VVARHPPPSEARRPSAGAILLLVFWAALAGLPPAAAEDGSEAAKRPTTLVRAVMCDGIDNFAPVNPAVVFPISIGRIFCFTTFDPVAAKTFIHHDWYCRDKLCKRVKLDLQPPRWSTYSSIQLREEDKGPWHVNITASDGEVLQTLRFSISD